MKFIYFFSKEYEWFNIKHQENMSSIFEVEGLRIDSIRKENDSVHTFSGKTIKIELIIEKIKENLNNYIVFSDANIIYNPNKLLEMNDFFNQEIEKEMDLVFMDNNNNHKYNKMNIGLSLIKCSQLTLDFFEKVKQNIKKERMLVWAKGWDQAEVNYLIENNSQNLKINKFIKNKFWAAGYANKEILNSYCAIKIFGNHHACPKQTLRNKIEAMLRHQIISEEDYFECISYIEL